MSTTKLIGRKEETQLFEKYLSTGKSEFIAVYGRRRVGKTFLIRQVVGDRACFKFTGMENAELTDQLTNFFFSLRKVLPGATRPKSWLEAFDQLQSYIESLPAGRKIIVIDELPWLDTVRSRFVGALEHFWNGWADARDDIKLIVCGSATSWMIDNIINNRGGLHNRKTHEIFVAPFTLNETKQYFEANGYGYRDKEIAECYMVLGGVAYYYSLMSPQESVAQNIDRLFFASRGDLRSEFQNLYRSLYKNSTDHVAIVTALATKGKGLTRKQILEKTKLNNNHKLTQTLTELEQCGFMRSYLAFGGNKRDTLYQLTDAFTLFHFHYMEANKYHNETFWTNSLNSPQYRAWSGLAFEMLCLNHLGEIKRALGIAGVQSRACSWISKQQEGKQGAQVDLIIDRADQTINLCEMKFSNSEFEIDKNEEAALSNKIDTFISQTKTRKSIMLTLITSFGLKQNKYSGRIQRVITLQDLFD